MLSGIPYVRGSKGDAGGGPGGGGPAGTKGARP